MRDANYYIFKQKSKKTAKKVPFWAALFHIEIRTLSPIISLKNAEFLNLTGIAILGIVWYLSER